MVAGLLAVDGAGVGGVLHQLNHALIVLCIPQGGQGLDVTPALSDPGVKFVVLRGQICVGAQYCPVRPKGRGQIFRAGMLRPAVADVVLHHAAAYTHIHIVGVGDRVAGGGELVPVDVFHCCTSFHFCFVVYFFQPWRLANSFPSTTRNPS